MNITLDTESALLAFAHEQLPFVQQLQRVYFSGELGAGKTTLVRRLVQGLGHKGAVKSPTYTLVESYEFSQLNVHHFDLYRINDPEELEAMGIRDYFIEGNLCLIEWPERGAEVLPEPDLHIHLEIIPSGRRLTLEAISPAARSLYP